MNFKRKLQAGLIKPYRNKNYLKYVASLECPCGNPADEAHHIIDAGLGGGMGTKQGDIFSIPVCRGCHTLLHGNVGKWESIYGAQTLWIALTIAQAMEDGVIEV